MLIEFLKYIKTLLLASCSCVNTLRIIRKKIDVEIVRGCLTDFFICRFHDENV